MPSVMILYLDIISGEKVYVDILYVAKACELVKCIAMYSLDTQLLGCFEVTAS